MLRVWSQPHGRRELSQCLSEKEVFVSSNVKRDGEQHCKRSSFHKVSPRVARLLSLLIIPLDPETVSRRSEITGAGSLFITLPLITNFVSSVGSQHSCGSSYVKATLHARLTLTRLLMASWFLHKNFDRVLTESWALGTGFRLQHGFDFLILCVKVTLNHVLHDPKRIHRGLFFVLRACKNGQMTLFQQMLPLFGKKERLRRFWQITWEVSTFDLRFVTSSALKLFVMFYAFFRCHESSQAC